MKLVLEADVEGGVVRLPLIAVQRPVAKTQRAGEFPGLRSLGVLEINGQGMLGVEGLDTERFGFEDKFCAPVVSGRYCKSTGLSDHSLQRFILRNGEAEVGRLQHLYHRTTKGSAVQRVGGKHGGRRVRMLSIVGNQVTKVRIAIRNPARHPVLQGREQQQGAFFMDRYSIGAFKL